MDTLLRDIRYAVRGLARERAFTLTAVATLALGIGANTAMFSIVYGMLVRPLPYPDADAIVEVGVGRLQQSQALYLTNRSLYLLQDEVDSFEQLAAYRPGTVDWVSPDGVATLRSAAVLPSLFPLLRATPQLGRLFTEAEAGPGANRVMLLSHRAWAARFGSDPDIVGKVLDLGSGPHTVVGVLAEGLYFPTPDEEVWTPFVIPRFMPPDAENPDRLPTITSFTALGRLRPGVSPVQAASEVSTILQRSRSRGATVDAQVISLQEQLVGEYRPALLALTAAMALVLLIACSNVAGLLLARGVTRQRTLAVCAALGAGRGRLVRQLLTESVVLSLSGGAIGLAAAAVVLRAVPALVPGDIARLHEVGVDGVVLAFTLGLSVAVGLAFGAAPALQWSRLGLVRALNEGSAQSTGGFRLLRSSRARAALATTQVALALVLLVGAGLLLRSFVGLITIDRGYDPANVIAARTRPPDSGVRPEEITEQVIIELGAARRRFFEALLEETERMSTLPGVAAVGLSSGLPLAIDRGNSTTARVAGRPAPSDRSALPQVGLRLASPGYFDALRLRLRRGRLFTRLDGAGSPRALVVNETFAREVFGGEPALGRRVALGRDDEPWEVIGVVADIRYRGLTGAESIAEAFVSAHQSEATPVFRSLPLFITVRTIGDPLAVVPFIREAVAAAHPRAPFDDVMTMDARLSAVVAQPRFYAVVLGCFAGLALFLAGFGIYGLLSYTVSQRRREIGIRMALGAQRGDVVTLVFRQGAALVTVGAVLGLLAAAASSRVLESFLIGVTANDGLTFWAAPFVLAAAGFVACWLPARRATRIDPMEALRVE